MIRKLLLIAAQRDDLLTLGRALRDTGYLVFPARFHELGVDAMARVLPHLVLIDAGVYHSVESAECRETVVRTGARVLLFSRSQSAGDTAAIQNVAGLPYPVVEYSGSAHALAGLLEEAPEH